MEAEPASMLRGLQGPRGPEDLKPPCTLSPLRAGNGQTVKRNSPAMMLPRLVLAFCLVAPLALPASAQEAPQRHHALSLIGAPKYPADFKHFDYVNPQAPQGGTGPLPNCPLGSTNTTWPFETAVPRTPAMKVRFCPQPLAAS